MQYGAFLPHIGPLARGDVLTHIRTTAQTAEALGFDSVWVGDHIVTPTHIASQYPYSPSGAFPLNPQEPVLEPLSVLSFVAGCTRCRIVMPWSRPKPSPRWMYSRAAG